MNRHAGPDGRKAAETSAIKRLVVVFWSWKFVLVLSAIASPGPGYDTSTEVLLRRHAVTAESWLEHLVLRLTRWDGLYFASAAERGLLFEQQWAFSPFLAQVTSRIASVPSAFAMRSDIVLHALVGIALSHIAHLIAVLLLFQLTHDIVPAAYHRKQQIAWTTACLHVFSPAGVFLSAPYSESSFAMVNFAGLLCYARARQASHQPGSASATTSCAWTIASGLLIGVATMIRSNGLCGGFMFAWDALADVPLLATIIQQRDGAMVARLVSTLSAGVLVVVGYCGPQIFAYIEYCTGGNDRPWCHKTVPSIYSFVQSHYWGVGFLQYWTASNVPLFALATPMLVVLMGTGYVGLNGFQLNKVVAAARATGKPTDRRDEMVFLHTMRRLALPQIVLAVLAFTSFHVQIINRISSGYPAWYILLAIAIHSNEGQGKGRGGALDFLQRNAEVLIRASVVYAIVQGGLYASFMPPA